MTGYLPRSRTRRIFLYMIIFTICALIFIMLSKSDVISLRNYASGRLNVNTANRRVPMKFKPVNNNFETQGMIRDHNYLSGNLRSRLQNKSEPNLRQESVDFFLNVRKLVLFAVQELNKRVAGLPTNGCGSTKRTCSKWWTNPIKTFDLNTTNISTSKFQHDIIILADPGRVPFSVRINQIRITPEMSSNFTELEIVGEFSRLDDFSGLINVYTAPVPFPNDLALNSYNAADNQFDPELFSWKRHVSFMVGDYVSDFKDNSNLYKISPGEREKGLAESAYCGSALKMLVMVSSAPGHFENRKTIRETYGSEANLLTKQVRLVFLYGRVANETLQSLLEMEAAEHDDVIQADFMDSYHNLSLSHLLMYNWIQTTCEQVGLPEYILKVDDDFFINIDLALQVAFGNPQYKLIGTLYCGTPPIRDLTYMTKYYTPRYMYIPDMYVGYLSGVAYLLRTDIIPSLLRISLTTPMIHMDDVYITGLLPRQINIIPMGSRLFTYTKSELNTCLLKKVVCSAAESVDDIRIQYNEWIKPTPSNCSLDNLKDLLVVQPLRVQDKHDCMFE